MITSPTANLTVSRYDYALDRLRMLRSSLPTPVVYDLGCGDARMRKLEVSIEGLSWSGFDQTAWADVMQWDLTHPCPVPAGKAGAVLLLDVIEHCVNPGLALKNIGEAIAPEGRLILTVPNPRWSGSRAHTLFFGTASGFTQRDLDENHHVFTPWFHILAKLLHDAGFEIEEYVTLDGWTSLLSRPGKLFAPARYLLNAALIVMEHLDSSSRGMSYGLIARKVP